MELLKKPIFRVPLVLGLSGVLCRLLTCFISVISVRLQQAQGPDPVTGVYHISTGHATVIMAVLSFLIFWAAGWRFLRDLSRKQLLLSAAVMVLWNTVLLVWEQASQAAGSYFLWCYHLYATTESMMWMDQIMFRVLGEVSVPAVIPGLFTPLLYAFLGKKAA